MTVTTWVIYVGKRQYTLTEAEFDRLKNEIANNKTMVWYKDFVISIPYISSMDRVYEHKDEMPQLAEVTVSPAEASKRLAGIKKKLKQI